MMSDQKKVADIVFVILHYLAIESTIKAVVAIKENIDTENYKIVIVDNASPDKSGVLLQQEYKDDSKVKILLNDENLGFARGNNVGFKYAKEQYSPDYIVMLNNDVYILEKNLMGKLQKEYESSHFAVLGPLIMTRDGKCDINPYDGVKSKAQVLNIIKVCKRTLLFNKVYLLPIYTKLSKLKSQILHTEKQKYKDYIQKKYNVHLHGCCMFFSREYIDAYDGLDDRTFLYMEEDILYKHVIENGMITVYVPDIVIYHEEDASTNSIVNNKRQKTNFVYSNLLESCEILLDIYNYYEDKKTFPNKYVK